MSLFASKNMKKEFGRVRLSAVVFRIRFLLRVPSIVHSLEATNFQRRTIFGFSLSSFVRLSLLTTMVSISTAIFLFLPLLFCSGQRLNCRTSDGRQGQCRPLVKCIRFTHEIPTLVKQHCPLASNEKGVCCPHIVLGTATCELLNNPHHNSLINRMLQHFCLHELHFGMFRQQQQICSSSSRFIFLSSIINPVKSV